MLSLEMLDVLIGVVFIFLLLSLVCTAINEFIEGFLKLRAVDLEQGIRELLDDPKAAPGGLVERLFNHQLIFSLFRGVYDSKEIRNVDQANRKKMRYSRGSDLPSYIPARNFALALMDILLKPTAGTPAATQSIALSGSSGALAPDNSNLNSATPPTGPNPLTPLRDAVSSLANLKVKDAMLTIIDAAAGDAVKAREGIENWYNSSMDRVSGWYKRRVQQIVLIMGFIVAIALNADTIAIFRNLANDRPLRNAIVAQAQSFKYPSKNENSATANTTATTPLEGSERDYKQIINNVNTLDKMGLPIGWDETNAKVLPYSIPGWLLKVLGWLITGLAISLGAPFWFDVLNKIMVIRSTVKPTEKSPDEGSEDKK